MATYLANEINTTQRDTGPTTPVEILLRLKDKKMQGISSHFFWDIKMNKQSKKVKLCVIYNTLHRKIIELISRCARRLLKVTKSRLNNRICQHCGVKTGTVNPSFYYVFNISLSCNNAYEISSEIYGGFFY